MQHSVNLHDFLVLSKDTLPFPMISSNIATILERRKNTAVYLKQAAEQVGLLEDAQVTELKQQIKVCTVATNT